MKTTKIKIQNSLNGINNSLDPGEEGLCGPECELEETTQNGKGKGKFRKEAWMYFRAIGVYIF